MIVVLVYMLTILPFHQTIAFASTEVTDEIDEAVEQEEEQEAVNDAQSTRQDEESDRVDEEAQPEESKEDDASEDENDVLPDEATETIKENLESKEKNEDDAIHVEAPSRLQISTKSDTTVSLKWGASEGASSYDIYKNGEKIATSTDTAFVVEGLTPDTKSIYRVIAVDENQDSEPSNELEVKTNEVFKNIPIKDFGYLHTFASDSLKQVLEIAAFDEEYDQAAAQEMIERLELLPARINQEAARSNVRFVLTGFPVTYLPELAHLRGVVPYGREDAGQTWEDVPGVSSAVNAAKIGHSEPSTENGHSATNLEYHEYGHAIDNQVLGYSISKTEEFRAIQLEEKVNLWPAGSRNESYFNIPTEYFSETFAMYYVGGEAKARLKQLAPKTYAFQEALAGRFLSIDENTEQAVTLSWDPIDSVANYEIFRDGEKIGSTRKTSFTDIQFEDETVHVYQVKAVNDADEVINENFQREVQTKKNEAIELASPSGVQLVTKSDTTVTIKWNAVDEAEAYEVLRDGEVVASTEETTFEVTGLSPETRHEYTVVALLNGVKSPASEPLAVSTNEAYTDDEIVDFTDRHSFKYDALKELIEVLAFDETYDFDEAQKMIDRIALLPERIIEEAVKADVRLVFTDFAITYLPEYHVLRGQVPRGWEETGRTWDDVPGAGGQLTVSRIGYSDYGNGHSTMNLDYHEFGHAIDGAILGYTINGLEEFKAIHQEEKPKMWDETAHNSYYFDYPEEYFAEALAFYYLGGETKEELKEKAPKTYAFIEGLATRFFSFDENTSMGITLSWDPVENAEVYEIYRDGEKIGETDEVSYTDKTFTSTTAHDYFIQALNSNGQVINESFSRSITSLENEVVEEDGEEEIPKVDEEEPETDEDEVGNEKPEADGEKDQNAVGDPEENEGPGQPNGKGEERNKEDDEKGASNKGDGMDLPSSEDQVVLPVEDGRDPPSSEKNGIGKILPKTATAYMNMLVGGLALMLIGWVGLRLKRKNHYSS